MRSSTILTVAALAIISTADAKRYHVDASRMSRLMQAGECPVDPSLPALGPYLSPSIELTGGNKLLQQPSSGSSFSVDIAGVGTAQGVIFTVPPFSQANVSIDLAVPAFTSQQVRDLREAWWNILNISQREELLEYERRDRSASANLGFFGWFSGGGKGKASKVETSTHMQSNGLTTTQIDMIIEAFNQIAQQMSSVKLDYTIWNQDNWYAVTGRVLVWTMSGTITTNEQTTQFRFISDGGQAVGDDGNSNASGEILPLTL